MDTARLQELCEKISQQFPVLALPAQIIHNRRWECLSDSAPEHFPLTPPHRIKISEFFGVVLYDWPKLAPEQQTSILNMCED